MRICNFLSRVVIVNFYDRWNGNDGWEKNTGRIIFQVHFISKNKQDSLVEYVLFIRNESSIFLVFKDEVTY